MKRVFTTSEDVIHLFAQQIQTDARCSNVFFEKTWTDNGIDYGNKIYSYGYHYLLGQFITDKCIIINNEGYSVTTTKHIHQITWATSHFDQFLTSNICIKSALHKVKANLKKLAKARKKELYISPIKESWYLFNEFQEYIRTNKIQSRYKVKYNSKEYLELKKLCKSVENETPIINLIEHEKEQTRKRKKREKTEIKRNLKKFYAYEINSMRIGKYDYLRLSQNGDYVETTQGVRVKTENAITLYKMILRGIDIKGHKIEHYTVISINGTLKIGCHNIDMKSVHKLGKLLISNIVA